MITVIRLDNKELIDKASLLLYQVYINEKQWKFEANNPSDICVEERDGQKFLIDRFTDKAIWFGVFDQSQLIGCARLYSVDQNNKLEIESYRSSYTILTYLPKDKNKCVELTKVAVDKDYLGKGIYYKLFLAAFNYCEQNQYSLIACTHNGYLKSLFKKIRLPLKLEHAFKYEEDDPMAVNFYFADYAKSEVKQLIFNLEKLMVKHNSIDILKALEIAAPTLPTPVYWHDTQGVLLGINEHCLKAIGTSKEVIGKTPYEFYPKEIAEYILAHNELVMRTGEILSQEEKIKDITTGQSKYFSSVKAPLYDDEGNILGIVGTSIDITAKKEAEQLQKKNELLEIENTIQKFENEKQKVILNEQEKFKQITDQVAHDIRSPLATLEMVLPHCNQLSEDLRLTLKRAVTRISDIANNLLNKYIPNQDTDLEETARCTSLISSALLELLTEKKYEYNKKLVEFITDITPAGYFAFINIDITAFKRMLSNLINNAIDAFDSDKGRVTVHLDADNETVEVIIEDSGKGMSPAIIDKILNAIAVTAGKKDGHGIGLTQVRDTLMANQGNLRIESIQYKGTKMILSFPKAPAPDWICQSIELTADSLIIILDDDQSIHGAWVAKLDQAASAIKRKNFTQGKEAIDYICACNDKTRANIVLLTDYELLAQGLNGLDVIKQTKLNSVILISSHYNNKSLLETAKLTNTKILPKSLASVVPINISAIIKATVEVDLVIIDDDKNLISNLLRIVLKDKNIDVYHSAKEFLTQVPKYVKDTKFLIDNQFKGEALSGIDIAKRLYQQGFTKLYLYSGDFDGGSSVPNYLTIIKKTDINAIQRLVRPV